MHFVIMLALAGGLFSIFTFIHFFVDWIFQSHSEAMVKHNNPKIRAKHCAIYTLGFVPLLIAFVYVKMLSPWELIASILILFFSHFAEDTYLPVFLWAKYIRRPPEMTEPIKQVGLDGYVTLLPPDAKAGFVLWVQTTMGKILLISIDQIIHLTFLLPIIYMILHHI